MPTLKSFLLALFTVVSVVAYAGEKRALIIAIGNYPANSGWNNLSSVNDARLMQTELKSQGFSDKNITILSNEQATKTNILKSLETLLYQSNSSDVVVFHFSGHGQQITDLNGDEPDGYDEALIPYDAQKSPSEAYRGKNHLLDDELNGYLNRLRKKTGPAGDVIFFLDACHSGTATRGTEDNAIYRGTTEKFELKPSAEISAVEKQSFDEQINHQERAAAVLSPYVVISASGQQEFNREIRDQNKVGYGSLTYALGKVLRSMREKLTYSALFDCLCNEMWAQFAGKHQQNPQLEGIPDRLLFAGNSIEVQPHCRVISEVNSAKVVIDAGELNGLTIGSEVSFYPINTSYPEKAELVAKGTVKRVGLAESEVSFDQSIEKKKLINTWAFVTRLQSEKANVNDLRADILRRASASEPSLNVSFELVDPQTKQAIPLNRPLKIGESYLLRISNNGSKDAFFQIIDIWPDNQIKLVFDASEHLPNDLYIRAGLSRLLSNPVITMNEPTGVEMFKLVASEKQLDLTPIITQQPVKKRGALKTDFEQMISDLFEAGSSRSISSFSLINIFTRTFTIKGK